MKEQYIEAINRAMSRTEDIGLLDFICQLLLVRTDNLLTPAKIILRF